MRKYIKIVLIGIFVFTGGLALGSFVMIGIKTQELREAQNDADYWENRNTDSFEYTEVWMCGDFSAMLMTRAKEMNWRMRIACMFWSYDGDDGWQDVSDPYGEYGHAFNFIVCQDGGDDDSFNDIYYIEPQTDTIWYVHYGDYNHNLYLIWYTFGGGIAGTVWTEPYFINHFSYFA